MVIRLFLVLFQDFSLNPELSGLLHPKTMAFKTIVECKIIPVRLGCFPKMKRFRMLAGKKSVNAVKSGSFFSLLFRRYQMAVYHALVPPVIPPVYQATQLPPLTRAQVVVIKA